MISLKIYLQSGKVITIDHVTEWEARKNAGKVIDLTYRCVKGSRNVAFVRPEAIDCIVECQTHADRVAGELIDRISQLEEDKTTQEDEERGREDEALISLPEDEAFCRKKSARHLA